MAQFVNVYLIGPPPRVELLLLVTAIMTLVGGASAYFVANETGKVLIQSVAAMRNNAKEETKENVKVEQNIRLEDEESRLYNNLIH